MRAVVQRVARATVRVESEVVGRIERGLCVLVGVAEGDGDADAEALARKIATLRIFEDEAGKMNLSVLEVEGRVLAVSQFTLLGDARKGRRPSFASAMEPAGALALFERFCASCRSHGIVVETGRFGASMLLEVENVGPVTILLDSAHLF